MSEIRIENVTKTYGNVTSLDDVSLTIPAGCTFGLLGTNGAGKTTLFRLLVGHEYPDSGVLDVGGYSPAAGASIRQRVGYLPENAGFPDAFTGREVLSFHADVRGVPAESKAERIDKALRTVGLSEAADRSVGGYSNGMNRRLGLATVLMGKPAVLLLDEPFSGLDPIGVEALTEVLNRLASETSMTIVLTSHTLVNVQGVCDRIAILDDGRVQLAGRISDLKASTGDAVSILFRTSVEDAASRVAEELDDVPTVGVTDQVGDSPFRVRCGRENALEVIQLVHDLLPVEAFEVHEPDLDAVFAEAVGHDSDAPVTDRVEQPQGGRGP